MVMLERRRVVVLSDEEWLEEHRRAGSKRSRTDLLAEKRMGEELPYGMYVSADNREVLFCRGYWPIWQRQARDEWVVWTEQHIFYEPGRWTWRNAGLAAALGTVVHEFRMGGPVTCRRLYSWYRPAPAVPEGDIKGGYVWRSPEEKAQAERVVLMVRRRVLEVGDLAVLACELAGEGIAPGQVEWLLMNGMVEVGAVHCLGGRERCLRQIERGLWLAKNG
jgi:hypothetical protein